MFDMFDILRARIMPSCGMGRSAGLFVFSLESMYKIGCDQAGHGLGLSYSSVFTQGTRLFSAGSACHDLS